MNEKVLYKKDSKGKIRVWKVYTQGSKLVQEAGLLDGKLVVNSKVCTPKNVGKSNATTPEQQALLELQSEWLQKQDEGYFQSKKEAETEEVILPMLAKSYGDEKKKIDWKRNVWIQPKLDGMRCLAHVKNGEVKLVSRDGKTIEGLQHIRQEIETINSDIILDGELYAHGLGFQENMRLIKKYRPGETEQVKFHVYDVVSKENYTNRRASIIKTIEDFDNCEIVDTFVLFNEKEISKYHALNLKDGYEGSIIRHGDEGYKVNGRSSNLLKYKDFLDIAAKIVDVVPADQRPSWGVPVLEYKGKTFQAGMKFSHAEREEWLTNKRKYVGKTAEIRFFEYSEDGIPRFPVCVGVRLDK